MEAIWGVGSNWDRCLRCVGGVLADSAAFPRVELKEKGKLPGVVIPAPR